MARHVVVLGALSAKGQEVGFLRWRVHEEGGLPLVVDTGVLGQPSIAADVSRQRVAEMAGTTLDAGGAAGDKARALLIIAEGATAVAGQLLSEDRLGGVLSIGGSLGTALGTRAMQCLPVGIPRPMASTMATGHTPFGPYVGTHDVTIIPSVADILGVNQVTRPILTNTAAAIVAMSRVRQAVGGTRAPALAASMLGASTTLVENLRTPALADDLDLVAFHAVGAGGRAMDELNDSGLFCGLLDVTLAEVVAWLVGGPHSAGPDRMRAAGSQGIPQAIAPGGLDSIIEGPQRSGGCSDSHRADAHNAGPAQVNRE